LEDKFGALFHLLLFDTTRFWQAVGEEKQEEGREGGGILDNRGAFKGHVSKCARNRHGACDINNGGNEKHLSH
jgi:hypothetical protein